MRTRAQHEEAAEATSDSSLAQTVATLACCGLGPHRGPNSRQEALLTSGQRCPPAPIFPCSLQPWQRLS